MSPTVPLRHRALIASVLSLAFLLLAALPASAQQRISREPGFNARAWSLTTPDADGIRYVGGDFTSYNAWRTGRAAVVSTTDGAVDSTFPHVTGGLNYDVAPDGNGGYYIAGGVSSVDGSGRSKVAHILADGSLNPNFNPSIDHTVTSIEVVGSAIIIGGLFQTVNGQPRNRVAAFDTDGDLLSFNPNANGWVMGLNVDGDDLYVLGPFSQIGGVNRSKVARIRLGARTGGRPGENCLTHYDQTDCLTSFAPTVDGWGAFVAKRWNSTIFIAGSLGANNHLQAFNATTGASETSWAFAVDNEVMDLELVGSTLYAAGQFSSAKGTERRMLAAFDLSNGGALTTWNPVMQAGGNYSKDGGNQAVFDIDIVGSTAYLAGSFWSINGTPRNRLGSVSTVTGEVTSWDPHVADWSNGVVGTVRGIEVAGTKAMIVGDFQWVGGLKRNHTAAIGADGILTPWSADANGPVFAFSRLGSTIYMVGNFTAVNGAARVRAAAVTTAGSVTAWDPQPGGDRPVSVVATANKVYLGGFFGTIGGVTRRGVAAVDPTTGALDTAFDANLDGHVRSMALSGSTLYIGGSFANAGGAARDSVAGLNISDGSAVAGWNAGPLGADHGRGIYVENVTMDIDGSRVFLGGSFSTVNNVTRRYAVALDAQTGAVDQQWAPPLQRGHNGNGDVFAIAPTADAIYLGGQSQMRLSEGGQDRYGLGAVDPQSGAILPWTADTSEVRGLSASDAAVFIAGSFSSVGGAGRNNTAAVDVDGSMLDPWPMDPTEANPLVITMAGTSSGAVVSNPGGINCGGSCAYAFTGGQSVTLTAVPAAGSDFDGWGGACTGDSTTCTVAMTAARSATATFVPTGTGGGGGGGGGSTPPSSGPGSSDPGTDGDADTAESTPVAEPTVTVSNRFTIGKARFVDGLVRLRVGVPGAGTVQMRVTRTVMRKGRAVREAGVCTTRIRFTGEGARVVRCRINNATRSLRTNGAVRLRVYVTYTPAGGTAASKTTSLRLPRQTYSGAESVTG